MNSSAVPFFQHDLGEEELIAIARVFQSSILTTGDTVASFERQFAEYLGVRHALGLTSCTGALHLSLLALDIGPGDEVITSPMTFIATATAILEAGAQPVLVDVDSATGLLDCNRVAAVLTERTRAIIPVHLYGQMCDMRSLRTLADRHGLYLIEDAAHCIEGMRDGIRPGQLGDTACFSFYATKNMTCGEGGAVVANDARLAERLRLLRLHGMTKTAADRARHGYQHWDMVALGWKYNMDNIQAAILLPQLQRLENNWRKRNDLVRRYLHHLGSIPGVSCPLTLPEVKHANHLFPVWVRSDLRDHVVSQLHKQRISCMVNYRAIHLLTYFRERLGFSRGAFPNAECIGDCTLSLPLYPTMPPEQVDLVCACLRDVVTSSRAAA